MMENQTRKRKADELEDESSTMVHINGQKYIKVMNHHCLPMVNIRQYKTDVEGTLHPTKKGILLSSEDWKSLKKQTKTVDKLLKRRDDICQYL